MDDLRTIRAKFMSISDPLDERARRIWAAAEVRAIGWGGVSLVAQTTELFRATIHAGLKELESGRKASAPLLAGGRKRRPGGGRRALTHHRPGLVEEPERLVETTTCGDPMSPLRWTCKSTTQLAEALTRKGTAIRARAVASLLQDMDYSHQGSYKTKGGTSHPDRDAQFRYISRQKRFLRQRSQPVVSVDTKKKELVGPKKNGGRESRPKGQPELVNSHDFKDEKLGKAIPYGVYDLTANAGWLSVGVDHDTPAFAVASIQAWWMRMGRRVYPRATELLITADCGGRNSYRARLWKMELQRFADATRLRVAACHFPPRTSKWNKIEHRMFCHITENWRARPLISHEVVGNLIGATSTKTGLRIRATLDRKRYPKGVETAYNSCAELLRTHRLPISRGLKEIACDHDRARTAQVRRVLLLETQVHLHATDHAGLRVDVVPSELLHLHLVLERSHLLPERTLELLERARRRAALLDECLELGKCLELRQVSPVVSFHRRSPVSQFAAPEQLRTLAGDRHLHPPSRPSMTKWSRNRPGIAKN
jgi:hypothetical protein